MVNNNDLNSARQGFEASLNKLQSDILLLGDLVIQAINKSINSLKTRNIEQSEEVIKDDDNIDELETQIQVLCVELIRKEAPLASDLRRIVSALQIVDELERVGDYAEGIAKISITMGNLIPINELVLIPKMAENSVNMLSRSLESYTLRDFSLCSSILEELRSKDKDINAMHKQVQKELLNTIKSDSSKGGEQATYLMWAAHNLERIADRSKNIAERSLFQVTGEIN